MLMSKLMCDQSPYPSIPIPYSVILLNTCIFLSTWRSGIRESAHAGLQELIVKY